MNTIVTAETLCAVFTGMTLVVTLLERSGGKSARRLKLNMAAVFLWLLTDIAAYYTQLSFVPTMLTFSMGSICLLCFAHYCEALIEERTEVRRRLFLVPKIGAVLCAVLSMAAFIAGKVVAYENGVAGEIYGNPVIVQLIQVFTMLYCAGALYSKKQAIGLKSVVLMGLFVLAPIFGIALYLRTGSDYSVVLSALCFLLIYLFIDSDRRRENMKLQAEHELIADNNSRIMALEDNFVSLYDLDLETGSYEIYVKKHLLSEDKVEVMVNEGDFFADTVENAERVVVPEDRDGVVRVLNRDFIRNALEKDRHYDYYYRLLTGGEPVWAKMRIAYKDERRRRVVIGVFSADTYAEVRQKEERQATNAVLTEYLLKSYTTAYYANIRTGEIDVLQAPSFLKEQAAELVQAGMSMDYDSVIAAYAERYVHPDDRKKFTAYADRENMRRQLEANEGFTFNYRDVSGDEPGIYRCTVIRGADEDHVAAGFQNISEELRQQEEQRREAEEAEKLIKSVAGVYSLAFSFDMSGTAFRILRIDEEVRNFLGVREFRSYPEAIAPLLGLLHPGDRERMLHELDFETIRERLRETPSYNVEYRVLNDGAAQWHEMNVTHITRDEVAMGFGEKDLEITRRHIDNIRFNEYFGLYEADFDTGLFKVIIDSPYYTFSETGRPVPYEAAMRTFAERQKGDTREAFLKLADLEWLRQTLAEDDRYALTYYSVTADNSWVDVTSYVTMRHADGTPAMFVLGFSLASASEAARQELQVRIAEQKLRLEEQQKRLEDAVQMADAANRAKTDFLFNMSHDIRTPMNAIIGFTNIAKRELDRPEKARESLEKVQLSSNILLNLINDVLDMSRIESGKTELHETKYEIREAFDSISPAMASLAASKDIDLKFSIGNVRDSYVFADGPRFDRVLINIISNAIKYTPAGGFVRVTAEQTDDTQPGCGNYRFTVTDSGIGMSEEFQKHMFEDFTREENSTTSGIQGTGLGLPLAKKLVDMMGGTISCVSRQGIGTSFTIVFPFRLQTEEDIAQDRKTVREQAKIDLRGRRALLVEDNELNREIAGELLSDEGIELEMAEDGQRAVNMVRERGDGYYDFILMDIQMPVMDGYEATRTIHTLMPELKTPIIALSANAFEEDRKKSLEAGMDDHVAKPINMTELLAALARFM